MPVAIEKKKRTLLPLLTIVFLFSYGLMTMLIVEQGAVIQSQRNLIQVLMRDSTELWGMKGKAVVGHQVPSVQSPSTKSPSTQAPATQAVPQHRSQSHAGKIAKPQPQLPPMPASDLVDQRRTLRTI